jgi:hypothetical protein
LPRHRWRATPSRDKVYTYVRNPYNRTYTQEYTHTHASIVRQATPPWDPRDPKIALCRDLASEPRHRWRASPSRDKVYTYVRNPYNRTYTQEYTHTQARMVRQATPPWNPRDRKIVLCRTRPRSQAPGCAEMGVQLCVGTGNNITHHNTTHTHTLAVLGGTAGEPPGGLRAAPPTHGGASWWRGAQGGKRCVDSQAPRPAPPPTPTPRAAPSDVCHRAVRLHPRGHRQPRLRLAAGGTRAR